VFPSRGRDNSDPKKPAFKNFASALERGVDPEVTIRGGAHYAAAARRQGRQGTQYVQQMKTWLHNEAWQQYADLEDEPDQPLAAGMI
jgi:hypothetical protein